MVEYETVDAAAKQVALDTRVAGDGQPLTDSPRTLVRITDRGMLPPKAV